MKSILQSIKPVHCENTATGRKTTVTDYCSFGEKDI